MSGQERVDYLPASVIELFMQMACSSFATSGFITQPKTRTSSVALPSRYRILLNPHAKQKEDSVPPEPICLQKILRAMMI
jgi:hypothetical protein